MLNKLKGDLNLINLGYQKDVLQWLLFSLKIGEYCVLLKSCYFVQKYLGSKNVSTGAVHKKVRKMFIKCKHK